MSAFLSIISAYGLEIFTGVAVLAGIVIVAICNAEECPYPAGCFNCSDTSCRECSCLNPKKRPDLRILRSNPGRSDGYIQPEEAFASAFFRDKRRAG